MSELCVCRTVHTPPQDRITDPAISDHWITLHIANPGNTERNLERRLDGEKLVCRPTYPGTFTFVPAFRSPQWFWESEVEVLNLYLPHSILKKIAIESCDLVPSTIELRDRIGWCDPLLEQLLLTFSLEVNQNTHNSLYLDSLKNLIAVHLLQHHCSVEIAESFVSGGLPNSKLQTVLDYIQTHLDSHLGLEELANLTQLSSHHFGKLFKQSIGASPHQYVSQRRVERAKQLLANQQLSLVEIGRSVGFYDQSHFTNSFRRHTGLTPRQYRQQH
ncbi:MAG: AraC family transcriptional regulator [Stenomitos rutilans HA7619-LM2]|jgi:AraC family transcriptional regulator|nr:AraC family transcriptional regulator [Stenomitos rutilans HA7619-LM2]